MNGTAPPRQLILFAGLLMALVTVSYAATVYNVFLNHEQYYTVSLLNAITVATMLIAFVVIVVAWSILGVWWFFRGEPT